MLVSEITTLSCDSNGRGDLPQPRPRIVLRISLRATMFIIGVLCALLAWTVHRAHKQKRVVGWIEGVGGAVVYDYQAVFEPTIRGTLPGPDWLCELIGIDFFATVAAVGLDNTEVTEVWKLVDVTELAVLGLQNTKVSDLASLSRLTCVSHLDLTGTQVTDVTPLANLTELQYLLLRGTQVTDLSPLERLRELKMLDVRDTPVTDRDVAKLQLAFPDCWIKSN